MASFFSFPLNCYPLYNLHRTLSQPQGYPGWSSDGRKLQSSITSTKEIQLNWSNGLNRGILSVNRSYFIMSPWRHFCLPFSNHVDVSCCSYAIISGFWVGPDTDDGWGFVEALVHQI